MVTATLEVLKNGKMIFISSEDDNTPVVIDKVKPPVYDMSIIKSQKMRFIMKKSEQEKFRQVSFSIEGRKLINELKNERTNQIIQSFLKTINHTDKTSKVILDKICSTDFNSSKKHINNLISFKSLGITKKEIYDLFKVKGLI